MRILSFIVVDEVGDLRSAMLQPACSARRASMCTSMCSRPQLVQLALPRWGAQSELEDLCFAVLQPDEYHTLRRGLDQLWGLNSLPDEAALGAPEHPGAEPNAGASSRAPAPAAAAERGAETPSTSVSLSPSGELLRATEALAGVAEAAQVEAHPALGRAGGSAGAPGLGGFAAAHGAPAGFAARRGGAEAAGARPSAGAAPASGGPGDGVGFREPAHGGAALATPARAVDLFPVATAPAVHPLAAAPGPGAPGRLRRRRARELKSAAQAVGGPARPGAASAAAVDAGNVATSSFVTSAQTGPPEAAARGGAAEAVNGGGGSAAAADSPGPNPSGAARPLSREQRRARALVASVLPFDAVTFRSRRRSEQVPRVSAVHWSAWKTLCRFTCCLSSTFCGHALTEHKE